MQKIKTSKNIFTIEDKKNKVLIPLVIVLIFSLVLFGIFLTRAQTQTWTQTDFSFFETSSNVNYVEGEGLKIDQTPSKWDEWANLTNTSEIQENLPKTISSSDGGVITVWFNTYDMGLYTQKLNENGEIPLSTTWADNPNGVLVDLHDSNNKYPKIVSDNAGGAIVVWGEDADHLFAQRIDANGDLIWPEGMEIASDLSTNNPLFSIVSDGSGGVIVVWGEWTNVIDIYAQRIDPDGNLLWGDGGVVISEVASSTQNNPKVLVESTGSNAIIVWEDNRNDLFDIYAQKVNIATGDRIWDAGGGNFNGIPVAQELDFQSNPSIIPDNSGGMILAWQDHRNGLQTEIYAQRINSGGNIQWPTSSPDLGGIVIYNLPNLQNGPFIASDGGGGAIIEWNDERIPDSQAIYVQRVGGDGEIQWTENGVEIVSEDFTPDISLCPLLADGEGGSFIFWTDTNTYRIYTQRISSDGSIYLGWPNSGFALTSTNKQCRSVSFNTSGEAFITISDWDMPPNDVYTQKIGSLDYYFSGAMASPIFDAAENYNFKNISWDADVPGASSIDLKVRTATNDPSNFALFASVSATSSMGGQESELAVDGDLTFPTSFWASDGSPYPQEFEVDFGSEKTVGKIYIKGTVDSIDFMPSEYSIETWDTNASSWIPQCTGTNAAETIECILPSPVETSKAKIVIQSDVGGGIVAIGEFEVYSGSSWSCEWSACNAIHITSASQIGQATLNIPDGRFVQYQATLNRGSTPTLYSVGITYGPPPLSFPPAYYTIPPPVEEAEEIVEEKVIKEEIVEEEKIKEEKGVKISPSLHGYYPVQKGDYLRRIALYFYGNANIWYELVLLNKDQYPSLIRNPNFIQIGWILKY